MWKGEMFKMCKSQRKKDSRSPHELARTPYLGQKKLPRQLHLRGAEREVAEETALLLNQERLGQRLGLGLQDLDPFLQLADQVVQLVRAGDAVRGRSYLGTERCTRKCHKYCLHSLFPIC